MADYLGVHPATVSRLEDRKPGDEPGAIKRLLDMLEADPGPMPHASAPAPEVAES